MKQLVCTALLLSLTACAVQQYGRAAPVSDIERQEMGCKDLHIELTKAEAFLADVQRQRGEVTGRHVIGALLDAGMGNALEGSAAETSGQKRVDELREIMIEKNCIE